MSISIGERLPDASFRVPGEEGTTVVSTADIFPGKRVVLFAVPGAFTPTCSMNHLPSFLEHNDALRAKGIDTIAVVAVNDVHVMKAWKQATEAGDRILFLSDGNGEFAKALGLDADLSAGGLGTRSKRYSMLVEDGVVRQLNVEPSPGQADASSAETLLGQI